MNKTLLVGTQHINISWDDNHLNNLIESLFAPWNCDSISSSYDISIISQKTGYILKTKSGSKQCYNQYELISQLEFAITLLSQNILSKYIQIHASCIEKNGHGILFVGDHESGKSTLALTAISSGFKALTDDIAVLDINKRCVIGFPRPFKATENTFNIKPNMIPEELSR